MSVEKCVSSAKSSTVMQWAAAFLLQMFCAGEFQVVLLVCSEI